VALTQSGTNGYVQRNLSHVKPRDAPRSRDEEVKPRHVQSDEKILEHERKRKIEIQCIELQDELEEKGCVFAIVVDSVFRMKRFRNEWRHCVCLFVDVCRQTRSALDKQRMPRSKR